MTFYELDCLLKHKDDFVIEQWAMSRFQAAASLNSNPYMKKAVLPKDLIRLPIDKPSIPPPTKDDFEKEKKKLAKIVPFKTVK